MPEITYTEHLVTVTCWRGINYAIPRDLNNYLHQNPRVKSGYCPLGHAWSYTGKSDAEKLQEQLDREKRAHASLIARLDQEKASHSATKGQLTKARKRAARGVCQCCKRSFVDVARHMETRHPQFVAETANNPKD